jgi:hypothetical protein
MEAVMRSSFLLYSLLAIVITSHASADAMWSKVGFSGGDVSDIASFPSNPDVMLACVADHGLFRSTDRGDTWLRIMSAPCYDISISQDNVAFIAGESGVMVSRDDGATWTSCLADSTACRVFAYRDGIVAAGTRIYYDYHYIYPTLRLSRDNGLTWELWAGTDTTTTLLFHESGVVYRTDVYSVFHSAQDNWSIWTLAYYTPFSINEENPYIRFGFADSETVLYAYSRYVDQHPGGSISGGVFRSVDGGETFQRYTNISSVSAMERAGDSLIAGTPEGSLFTASLKSGVSNAIGSLGGEITAIDTKRFGSGELIVGTKGGIFKTTDGGLHWRKSDAGIMHPEIASVQVIPSGSGGERIIVSTKASGVFYSDDAGKRWTWAHPDVRTIPGLLRVSASAPRRIYAAEASIHVSRDNGESWERIERIPASYYGWYGRTTDIEIDPRDADRIAVNYFNHSLDDIRGIHYCDGRFVDGIENAWDSWEWKIPFDSGEQFRSQFSDDGGLVWVSANRYGAEVKPLLVGLDDTGNMVRSITLPGSSAFYYWLIDGQSCYVFSEQEKRFRISPDLGETWDFTDLTVNNYDSIHCIYPHSAGHFGDIVLSPDGRTLFLLYPGNGVLSSGDGGRTWYQLNKGLDTAVVYQLAFSPANPSVIYAATNDGLYRLDGLTVFVNTKESRTYPDGFTLRQNTPNPFNPFTTISFQLPRPGAVNLSVYSITGQKVRTLVSSKLSAGTHSVSWDGQDDAGGPVSSGVYLSRLESGGKALTGKMLLIK